MQQSAHFDFFVQVYTPNVDENAGPNTLVTTVVASDKDGDGVTFGFVGGTSRSGLFRIEENTGVIRLIGGEIRLDRDKWVGDTPLLGPAFTKLLTLPVLLS